MLGPATATYSGDDQMESDQNLDTKQTMACSTSMTFIGESHVFAAVTRAPASLLMESRRNSLNATSRISLKIAEVLDFAIKWGSFPVVDFDVLWPKILWSVDIVCQLIEVITTLGTSFFKTFKRYVASL